MTVSTVYVIISICAVVGYAAMIREDHAARVRAAIRPNQSPVTYTDH